jgi:hypothetical protein
MLPIIMITGLVMVFHWPGAAVVGWAAALHFAAVGALVCGLMVHVYMGAVFPEEGPAFFSMLIGSVDVSVPRIHGARHTGGPGRDLATTIDEIARFAGHKCGIPGLCEKCFLGFMSASVCFRPSAVYPA